MIWAALKATKILDCRPGFGSLMELLRSGSSSRRAAFND
jgi:hypothetical protein